MKPHHVLFFFSLLLTLAALGSSITPARAQGNLLANNQWRINSSIDFGGVVELGGTTSPTNPFSAYFSGGIRGNDSRISQTIEPTNAQEEVLLTTSYFALSFSALSYAGTNTMSVTVNNNLVATLEFDQPMNYFGAANTNSQNFTYIIPPQFADVTGGYTVSFTYSSQEVDLPDPDYGYDRYFGSGAIGNISFAAVPEPSGVALLGAGLIGGLACRWGKRVRAGRKDETATQAKGSVLR